MAVTLDSAVLNPDNLSPNAKSVQVTERALDRIRAAMAKEDVSPEQGGLRLGVQGGGCSGLSYNIRFDTRPHERDRVFQQWTRAHKIDVLAASTEGRHLDELMRFFQQRERRLRRT